MSDRSNSASGVNRLVKQEDDAMTPLHQELGMTPGQIRAELIEQGLDPAEEAESLRRMGRLLAARYTERADEQSEALAWMVKRFARFDESASAGAAAWSAPAETGESASFMDVLGRADARATMWIRVRGWSMRDAGLQDGDWALVDTAANPRDGDVVVAHIEGEGAVVKRLRLTDRGVVLESANPDFGPIEVNDSSGLRIQGVVIGRGGRI